MYNENVVVSFDGMAYPNHPLCASTLEFVLNGKVVKRIIPANYGPITYTFHVKGKYGQNKFEFRGVRGGTKYIGMFIDNLKVVNSGGTNMAEKGDFFTRYWDNEGRHQYFKNVP